MHDVSPFKKSGEYLTFLFSKEDEEHLVPLSLFAKSHTIEHLVDHNNHVPIQNIASATFYNLTTYLSGNHQDLTPEKMSALIDAARILGLMDTVKELSQKFNPEESLE